MAVDRRRRCTAAEVSTTSRPSGLAARLAWGRCAEGFGQHRGFGGSPQVAGSGPLPMQPKASRRRAQVGTPVKPSQTHGPHQLGQQLVGRDADAQHDAQLSAAGVPDRAAQSHARRQVPRLILLLAGRAGAARGAGCARGAGHLRGKAGRAGR
jgi:hypothetical protein